MRLRRGALLRGRAMNPRPWINRAEVARFLPRHDGITVVSLPDLAVKAVEVLLIDGLKRESLLPTGRRATHNCVGRCDVRRSLRSLRSRLIRRERLRASVDLAHTQQEDRGSKPDLFEASSGRWICAWPVQNWTRYNPPPLDSYPPPDGSPELHCEMTILLN